MYKKYFVILHLPNNKGVRQTMRKYLKWLLPVIFIGGFLFHILWEAKGQYTLPYCVCLLPMCVWGYGFAVAWIREHKKFVFK